MPYRRIVYREVKRPLLVETEIKVEGYVYISDTGDININLGTLNLEYWHEESGQFLPVNKDEDGYFVIAIEAC